MSKSKGHQKIPLSFNRKMVGISASITGKKDMIHSLTEVDISIPRELIRQHRETKGEKLSFTAYLAWCLAQTLQEYPEINAFRKGRNMILLDDITISILVERSIQDESVPEPFGIQEVQKKNYLEIHQEIRKAQQVVSDQLGSLSKSTWVRFIPDFLMRSFFKLASRNIGMQKKYGVASITAVGMFGTNANWFIPHGGSTLTLTVGSIVNRPVFLEGKTENREHLCLCISFDHAIVDGAPAARFTKELTELIQSGTGVKLA